MHVGENSASSMSRNLEVRNQVINLDSPHLFRPNKVASIPLVQPNIAFMSTWQATLPNTTSTRMSNTVQPIGNQMGFILRALVAIMSYMPVNVGNLFATTFGGQADENDYANQVVPTHVGLSKRPLNFVGPIGLPNMTSFVPPFGGINQVVNKRVNNGEPSYVNSDVGLGANVVGHDNYLPLRTTMTLLIDLELLAETMKKYFDIHQKPMKRSMYKKSCP